MMKTEQTPNRSILPTKKQREIINFIQIFISEHGYSPSYREIMNGLNYNSVVTVAVHIDNLITRGHLRKRDHSARSLEPVDVVQSTKVTSNQVNPHEEKWLVEKIEHVFQEIESLGPQNKRDGIERLSTLIGALRILGIDGAAQSFAVRLNNIKTYQAQ